MSRISLTLLLLALLAALASAEAIRVRGRLGGASGRRGRSWSSEYSKADIVKRAFRSSESASGRSESTTSNGAETCPTELAPISEDTFYHNSYDSLNRVTRSLLYHWSGDSISINRLFLSEEGSEPANKLFMYFLEANGLTVRSGAVGDNLVVADGKNSFYFRYEMGTGNMCEVIDCTETPNAMYCGNAMAVLANSTSGDVFIGTSETECYRNNSQVYYFPEFVQFCSLPRENNFWIDAVYFIISTTDGENDIWLVHSLDLVNATSVFYKKTVHPNGTLLSAFRHEYALSGIGKSSDKTAIIMNRTLTSTTEYTYPGETVTSLCTSMKENGHCWRDLTSIIKFLDRSQFLVTNDYPGNGLFLPHASGYYDDFWDDVPPVPTTESTTKTEASTTTVETSSMTTEAGTATAKTSTTTAEPAATTMSSDETTTTNGKVNSSPAMAAASLLLLAALLVL